MSTYAEIDNVLHAIKADCPQHWKLVHDLVWGLIKQRDAVIKQDMDDRAARLVEHGALLGYAYPSRAVVLFALVTQPDKVVLNMRQATEEFSKQPVINGA